ncbi:MAG: hypothetical protein SA378_05420 [Sedimentibacter sp.]|uniref:hypothetical protein n=1 Tax=Sedimentibacter sp. TaxID=1960295 RepID=UPI0029814BC2|nr:hypothetical protein [Sedimentibacter sp.]MDW5299561.1 hypothetical protein [Sedimentibacter sp.]
MEDFKIKEEDSVIDNEQTTENTNDNYKKDNIIFQNEAEKGEKDSIFNFKYAVPILAGNLLLVIGMTILMFANYTSLNEANNKIMDLTAEVESMRNIVSDVENIKDDVSFLDTSIDEIRKLSYLTQLSLDASEGVVTDKVVIQKASLYSLGDTLYGYIDIRPQPSYNSYFQGQGKFNLTDRELKAMLEEVIAELEDYISPISMYNIKMEGGKIDITANNYSVAEYTDGVVILAGE